MASTERTDELILAPGTRLLHIGPPKTGTTGIQTALHRRRRALAEHGVVFPGRSTRPRAAVWSLLGHPRGWEQPPLKHWQALVREVEAAGEARVCISTEDWARADQDGAQATVDGLGGDRAHIVAAARPLHKLLPSQWQQRVKMRATTLSYEEWLRVVLESDDAGDAVWRNFWVPQDISSVVERWSKAAGGPERFTLVVSDESDRNLLPRTFERMLGLPAGFLSAAVTDVRNASIGYGRTEAIRHLSKLLEANGWQDAAANDSLSTRLTNTFKSAAAWEDEAKAPPLPSWAVDRVAELSEQRVRTVRSLGVRVVGDPDHLRFPASYQPAPKVPEGFVSAELAARAVEQAVAALLEERAAGDRAHHRQVTKLRRRVAAAESRTVDALGSAELLRVVAGRVRSRIRR